jgi:hypothetical protein
MPHEFKKTETIQHILSDNNALKQEINNKTCSKKIGKQLEVEQQNAQ